MINDKTIKKKMQTELSWLQILVYKNKPEKKNRSQLKNTYKALCYLLTMHNDLSILKSIYLPEKDLLQKCSFEMIEMLFFWDSCAFKCTLVPVITRSTDYENKTTIFGYASVNLLYQTLHRSYRKRSLYSLRIHTFNQVIPWVNFWLVNTILYNLLHLNNKSSLFIWVFRFFMYLSINKFRKISYERINAISIF